ncbi:hypothetical protein STENM223S_04245 [Streptomyces tendae]
MSPRAGGAADQVEVQGLDQGGHVGHAEVGGEGWSPGPSVRHGRPPRAPRATGPPRPAPAAAPVAGEAAQGGRAVRPSGRMPTQLMPAPHTTATPRGCQTRARRMANVSLRTVTVSDPARETRAAVSCSSSTGRSALAGQAERWVAPGVPADRRAAVTGLGEGRHRCGQAVRGRAEAEGLLAVDSTVPSRRSAASVLLLPASTARNRLRSGPREVLPVVRDQGVGRAVAYSYWPIRGVGGRARTRGPGRRAGPPPGPGPRTR